MTRRWYRVAVIDLHTHTVFSDGTTTPEANAALAVRAGLAGLALTDHDTTEGLDRQAEACRAHDLLFVPGLELSTELAGGSVHILGYWVDPENKDLAAECHRLRSERAIRAGQILERLSALGISIRLADVEARARGAPIGRPHIAAAMVDAGVVEDLQTAFDYYLADGGPAYVPKHAVTPDEGVRLIQSAGGAAVLAHPGFGDEQALVTVELVDRLLVAGLAGIEADHVGHEPGVRAYWREVAAERELLVTGSSDFHGSNKDVNIGDSTTPVHVVEHLRERAMAASPVPE